jgi:hypothetical protein
MNIVDTSSLSVRQREGKGRRTIQLHPGESLADKRMVAALVHSGVPRAEAEEIVARLLDALEEQALVNRAA